MKALVTGGSRGIGEAMVARFRKEGWSVDVPGRAELDLSDPSSVKAFTATGRCAVDVLVNNAGENRIHELEKIPAEDWARMLQINLTAPFQLIQACAPHMKAKRYGRILNISSVFSFLTRPGRAAYSASKSGLNGLTRTAALELGPHGILVNALCPGFVETRMTRQNNSDAQIAQIAAQVPLRRLALPEEMAETAFFLASQANAYITGQCVLADGGYSLE